jgi:hypothetical protein
MVEKSLRVPVLHLSVCELPGYHVCAVTEHKMGKIDAAVSFFCINCRPIPVVRLSSSSQLKAWLILPSSQIPVMNNCFCRENIRGQLTGGGGPEQQQPGQQLTVTRRHFETAFQSLRNALPTTTVCFE